MKRVIQPRNHGHFDVMFNGKPIGKIMYSLAGYDQKDQNKPVWSISAEWSGTFKHDHWFPQREVQKRPFLLLIQHKIETGDASPIRVEYKLKADGARQIVLPGKAK